MMTVKHVASVGFWIVIGSTGALGQQSDPSRPKDPAESAVIRSYPQGGTLPSRNVETRRESGGRELQAETVETPDADGKLRAAGETLTETTRRTPNVVQTKRDVFMYTAPGHRTLLETRESDQETLADGSSRTVHSTRAPDVNGHLGLTSREIQQVTIAPDVKRTETAVFRRDTGEALQESERMQETERQVGSDLRRTDFARSVRDINGRFQRTEERSHEVRTVGPSQQLEEETVRGLDVDGKLTLTERNVVRRSAANGQDQTVTETFRSDNRMELSQRVRRTTTIAADGGGQTIEEVEARNPVSPNEPLRLVQRTVETTRKVSADRWQTERQVFVLDINGGWMLAAVESGEQVGR